MVNETPSHSYAVSLVIIMGSHSVTCHPIKVNPESQRLCCSGNGQKLDADVCDVPLA